MSKHKLAKVARKVARKAAKPKKTMMGKAK
jgi:hypothetical protein